MLWENVMHVSSFLSNGITVGDFRLATMEFVVEHPQSALGFLHIVFIDNIFDYRHILSMLSRNVLVLILVAEVSAVYLMSSSVIILLEI